jgi:hypothetical protein
MSVLYGFVIRIQTNPLRAWLSLLLNATAALPES